MKKTIIIIGSTLVALIAIITFAISPIAEWYIQKHSKDLIGRKATMENLSVNIFSGRVKVDDFTLFEADETTPFVSFNLLDVNLNMLGLLGSKVEVEHVLLSDANIRIVQNEDYFNFNDIIDFFSDTTEVEDTTESDWDVIINDIHLDHSYVCYQDKGVGSEWNLKDISIIIPGIDLSDLQADMGLQLDFLNGGKLHTNVKYDTEKALYDLWLDIENFKLAPILPYLQQSLNVKDISGTFNTKLNLKGSTDHVMDFDANGTLTIADFKLIDSQDKELLAFSEAETAINQIDMIQNYIELNMLHVNGLKSYYEVFKDNSDNFTMLFKEDTTSLQTDTVEIASEDEKPLNIAINDLHIQEAEVNYIDHTLPQTFNYVVNDIDIAASNFDMAKRNNISLTATLQNSGRLKVKWIGSMEDISNQNITVNLNNLEISPFSPYSLAMFGNPITDGHISIQSQNIIVNNNLHGTNKINIYNPKIGDKDKNVKAEYNIPLKVGIYVLTDKNGKVDLDLPVSGNINSPDFSYGKIILKTLGTLLVKVAASPFKALNMGGDEFDKVEFTATANEFSDMEYAKFARIGALQQAKPELKVRLSQHVLYSKAITDYCLIELKKNMAIQDSTNSITEDNADDLIIRDTYTNISDKSPELAAFADKAMVQRGLKSNKKLSIQQKATLLYENDMKESIQKDMTWRNALLQSYLTKQCALSDTVFSISSDLIESDTAKNFKDHYSIEWILGDTEE